MDHHKIKIIPKDRVITYARILVDYRPKKLDPNRVRLKDGGNLIKYPGELTTRTADITTARCFGIVCLAQRVQNTYVLTSKIFTW